MKNGRYFFILIFTMALFILPNSTNVSAFEGRSNTFITPFSIIGEDGRTEVVNSEIKPYSSISFLFSLDSMCTGTIIDDDKVLTAAHCVYNSDTKQYYRNSTIYPGVNKDEFPFGSAVYFAIEKCREMQLKMQRFATHLIPFRQCVGQSIALAMKRDDMGVMN